MRIAGTSTRRVDARAKVTGAAEYCVDLTVGEMLHARVVRAERAHARIAGLDRAEALAVPGAVAVITADELDGLFPRFGHIVADHAILAQGKVRYYGEPVALVLAESPAAARDAAERVAVSYEDLPAVITTDEALAPDAPLVHEHGYDKGDAAFDEAHSEGLGGNLAHVAGLEWGDVDAALAAADAVVETETHYPMLYAYAMEPYNALAIHRGESLHVHSTAQHPFMVREDLARVFGLPLSQVRVSVPFIGGGYGSKSYTKVEPLAAVGSWYSGRPVKLVLDVEESIYTTRADAATVSVRSGFTADGVLLARDIRIDLNSGAYADNSPLVLAKAVNRCFGPYRVPNLRVRGRSVYTNTSPASSYRGFGAPQGNLAGELNMDQAAQRLGIDPAELRQRNLVDHGEELLPGKRPMDADLKADLELITKSLEIGRGETREHEAYGVGFGCSASDAGAFPTSTAMVRILTDGSVVVQSGSSEMGQGSRTVLAQIAAEELGVALDRIRVVQSDTEITPYERTTGASRTTTLAGVALVRACEDAKGRARQMAAELLDCEVADVDSVDAGVRTVDGVDVGYPEVIRRWFGAAAGEITGIGIVRRAGEHALLPPFWEIGMVGVGLRVDCDTGFVVVDQLATVADVGFALNPAQLEGQDLGAATQGLGAALFEELVYDGPQLVNPNVVEYRVPRATDMPRRTDTMVAARGDGIGPYGAKGGGEGTLNPIGGAVAAAIGRATGRWPTRLPLTPERVWRLLNGLDEDDD